MGLDGRWLQCSGSTLGKGIWTTRPGKGPFGGLSGSPLLTRDGRAAAVFVEGGDDDDVDESLERFPGDGPQPGLRQSLPGWLLKALRIRG